MFRDLSSSTVLHLAASNGAAHLVDTLIRLDGWDNIFLHLWPQFMPQLFFQKSRIEIDIKDASDRTPLHLASIENHPDVIKILLNAQAVDSYIDFQGLTALHYAVENNSLASLKAFAELTDITHIPDNNGRTPLMVAAQGGFDQTVEILIKNKSVAQTTDNVDGEGKSGEPMRL